MRRVVRRARKHWKNGRHAELPVCCILWFITLSATGTIYAWNEAVDTGWRPMHHTYVRCPVCVLRRRRVEQHLCPELACETKT